MAVGDHLLQTITHPGDELLMGIRYCITEHLSLKCINMNIEITSNYISKIKLVTFSFCRSNNSSQPEKSFSSPMPQETGMSE